jgi:hypothetical protein
MSVWGRTDMGRFEATVLPLGPMVLLSIERKRKHLTAKQLRLVLLTPAAHTFVPVDVHSRSVLVCDYTGKEVV